MSETDQLARLAIEEALSFGPQLARLCRIGQFEGIASLWAEALPWLCQVYNARGASLIYGSSPPIRRQYGDIPDSVRPVIEEWEQQVSQLQNWVPPESEPVSTPPPLPPIETPIAEIPLQAIPLWDDTTLIGGLTFVLRPEDTSEEMFRRGAVLAQAIALIARLSEQIHSLQQRLTHLTLFYDIGQKLTSSLDLSEVLQETTALAASVLDADASTLMLLDERTQELVFEIPVGGASGLLRQQRIPVTQGIAGWVARHNAPVICNDVANDPRFNSQVDAMTGYVTRSVICVPLQVKGRIIGVLEVLNKRQPEGFNQQDLEWLSTLGAQAAIAIENARLYENLRQEQERIIRVQEQERHALAQALHDGPTATLGAVIMSLEMAQHLAKEKPERLEEELAYLTDLARGAYRELRQRLFELRPVILQTRGLLAALRSYATQLQGVIQFKLHLELPESLPDLASQAAEAVFVIVQEAINNVNKHAQARNCWLRLWVDEASQQLVAEIEDDGRGFDVASVQERYDERGSLGLLGMQERAELLNARLMIISPRPGNRHGSLVRLEVPLERLLVREEATSYQGNGAAEAEEM